MSCKPAFSMPHGRTILYPFILALMSCVMSFRTLSSCDLIRAQWSIDCSSLLESQCVFTSHLNIGLLAKETYVTTLDGNNNNQPSLQDLNTVCLWYTQEERIWLLGNLWSYALVSEASVILIAIIGIFVIGAAMCYAFNRTIIFKLYSVVFGCCAIANSLPLGLQFISDFCKDGGICDPTESFCVSTCSWGSGSWQTLAGSFLWLSTASATWLIQPYHRNKSHDDNSKFDSENFSYDTNDSAEHEIDEENFR